MSSVWYSLHPHSWNHNIWYVIIILLKYAPTLEFEQIIAFLSYLHILPSCLHKYVWNNIYVWVCRTPGMYVDIILQSDNFKLHIWRLPRNSARFPSWDYNRSVYVTCQQNLNLPNPKSAFETVIMSYVAFYSQYKVELALNLSAETMVSFCSLQSTRPLGSKTGMKRGYGTMVIWDGECYPCYANIWKYYAAVSLMYYMVWHVNICTKFKRA